MTDVPNFHQVGRAASQDESPKHPESSVDGKIAMLADEVDESDGNAVIRGRNQAVGDYVQPHHPRIPEAADTVGH